MKFLGDYHTHTIFSKKPFMPYHHAKGTIEENIVAAKEKGLKEIAISDHGFNQRCFGCCRKDLQKTKSEILRLAQKYDMKVYFGVEANFISVDGTIDVVESDFEYLDIVLCGFHRAIKTKSIKDYFKFLCANMFSKIFGTSQKLKEQNTQMILNSLEKYNIAVLTHLNSKMKCNIEPIALKAAEKGTLIELNEKHCDFTPEEIKIMLNTKVNFIVNSDAHKPERIGNFEKVKKLIKENNIPEDRIVNLNKLPNFIKPKEK